MSNQEMDLKQTKICCRYWRQVDSVEDGCENCSALEFQCLNCKNEWNSDVSPQDWQCCPYCKVEWAGEFTKKNKRWTNYGCYPQFEIQHESYWGWETLPGKYHSGLTCSDYDKTTDQFKSMSVSHSLKWMIEIYKDRSSKKIRIAIYHQDGSMNYYYRGE
jgi:hypothetical protein